MLGLECERGWEAGYVAGRSAWGKHLINRVRVPQPTRSKYFIVFYEGGGERAVILIMKMAL